MLQVTDTLLLKSMCQTCSLPVTAWRQQIENCRIPSSWQGSPQHPLYPALTELLPQPLMLLWLLPTKGKGTIANKSVHTWTLRLQLSHCQLICFCRHSRRSEVGSREENTITRVHILFHIGRGQVQFCVVAPTPPP